MLVRYLAFWSVLAVVGVGNGVLRQATYGKLVPELLAHQISTATGILLTGLVVWPLTRIWPIGSTARAWTIGGAWLAMTVAFELGFGHYVAGHSWPRLLADYDLLAGRVWLLFLIWILGMPALFRQLRAAGGG
jgi:hypothetical protein